MSVQLILGAGGTGKSTYIYDLITKEAAIHKDKRYFVIVPDQFTMQTQLDMVKMSPGGGIMNIDVLSFARLAHRVFEETNCGKKLVLDDTGKSLILKKLALELEQKLPYISSNIQRTGFIHEVKSAISEFMQYGITEDKLEELVRYSAGRGALQAKLSDLLVIYKRFREYVADTYITSEESMDLLAGMLDKSDLIRNSCVVFDGFTGFTPVQMKVLGKLMSLCDMVYITLTLEPGCENCGEQSLFSFTAKSYASIIKTAKEVNVDIRTNVYCNRCFRFDGKPELAHLERNIFRYPSQTYTDNCDRIEVCEAVDVRTEVRHLAVEIRKLVSGGVQYRDIAVITGNLSDYETYINNTFAMFSIPAYIDKTRAIILNPFVEYTKSVLRIICRNYDTESIMSFLRCGMCGVDENKSDIFENYLRKRGIRGYKRYSEFWPDDDVAVTDIVNEVRESILRTTKPFVTEHGCRRGAKVSEYVMALYECYVCNDTYAHLEEYREKFAKDSEYTREKEYGQIYRLTMELLEQIYGLLGEEDITVEEFSEIIDAGFEEITVGTIPQSVDKVIVGDMERSRLKPVKYLFFIGVNDGFIPKKNSNCNIISDMEREFLSSREDIELAPTPRQKMYIQRFYLYNNLVKPSEKLYISYSLMDNSGNALRPAYIVRIIKDMFEKLEVKRCDSYMSDDDIYNYDELKEISCRRLREYANPALGTDNCDELAEYIDVLSKTDGGYLSEIMINNAFFKYSDDRLDRLVAGILYGDTMLAGVSRMEQYAECAYSYFLKYGLSLKEREEYSIDNRDLGTIFHAVLEAYGKELRDNEKWYDMDENVIKQLVDKALFDVVAEKKTILLEKGSGRYVYNRLRNTLYKAVNTIAYQLKAGSFRVNSVEVGFEHVTMLDNMNEAYNKPELMKINGRIDRIDTWEDNNSVYVKIIDYKTGKRDFSLVNFYYGLQLQLVMYMEEGCRQVAKNNADKSVAPAALLYYRVADETIEAEYGDDEETVRKKITESLKTRGIVSDDSDVVRALAGITEGKSDCIPVSFNKDGSYSKSSSVMSVDNLKILGEYAEYKLKEIGNSIISGTIQKNPIKEDERKNSCTYCTYKSICGFEERLEGYAMKKVVKLEDEEVMSQIKQELGYTEHEE